MRVRHIWPALIIVVAACSGEEATPTPAPIESPAAATVAATTTPTMAATTAPAGSSSAPADDTAQTSAALPDGCSLPPYEIEIRRAGSGENEPWTVIDAEDTGFGVGSGQNLAYKIFLADYDINDDEDLITQITPDNMPEGATVVNVDLGRAYDSSNDTPSNEYPNIEAGEPLTAYRLSSGPEATLGAQATITDPDGLTSTASVNPTASGTVLYADEEFICVDLDIQSEDGVQVKGIVTARVR